MSGSVPDEVDLYVKVDNGPGYSAVFLVECRDRKESADKNDVYVLLAKMARIGAQGAFFVARTFTKHARTFAEDHPSLRLCTVSDFDPTGIIGPWSFTKMTATVLEFAMKPMPVSPAVGVTKPDLEETVLLEGHEFSLIAAARNLLVRAAHAAMAEDPEAYGSQLPIDVAVCATAASAGRARSSWLL